MEDVVKFWDARPCNINHSSKPLGTLEYFQDVTTKKYIVEPHILQFADFPSWKNKRVLEVGCGIGTAAQSFIENGALYTGIDISSKSIDICKRRMQVCNLNGTVYIDDIEKSTAESNQYDLIYSFGVLHHTVDIKSALANIHRMLKPGGTFKLMLYAKNSWKNFMIKDGLDRYEAQNGCPIANVYTHEDVHCLLKNFTRIDIQQTHIFPYKIPEYKQHLYVKEDYFHHMPADIYECLQKNLGWHLCITCYKQSDNSE